MKKFLIKLVIESDTKLGRRFDVFIQILIVLSLSSFSVETIPDLDLSVLVFLEEFELFTVVVFSIELLLRLILTKPPFKYLISFFGILNMTQEIVIFYYPFLESYILYLYETIENIKIIITDFLSVY